MLLEYNLNTKEEDLRNTAIELRKRFAGRRLQEAITKGIITSDDVVRIKDSNRQQRISHHHDVYEITTANLHGRVTLGRAEHQFEIQGDLRSLDRDIARASRLGKSRIDTLNDLESRVEKLRYLLLHPSHNETLDTSIDSELRTSSSSVLERHFTICKRCNRRILTKLLNAHHNACKMMANGYVAPVVERPGVFDVNVSQEVALATFPPQPPRLCRISNKGSNFLDLCWEPPIIDGGLPIYDYEIRYKSSSKYFDIKDKAWKRKIQELPIISTSRWILRTPVCHHGYRLSGLEADTEYEDIYVRCINLQGPSEWANLLPPESPTIGTNTAKPTSRPLLFIQDKITSSCLHLSWMPPLFTGGRTVSGYMLYYTTVRRQKTVSGAIVLIEKNHSLKIESTETSFVVRNLPSSAILKNVYIKAVTTIELEKQNADSRALEEGLETKEASHHRQVEEEIKRAEGLAEAYIDTDFETGVLQRLDRKQYIRRLKRKLIRIPPDEEEEEEKRLWEELLAIKKLRHKEEEDKYNVSAVVKSVMKESGDKDSDDEDEDRDGAESKSSKSDVDATKKTKRKRSSQTSRKSSSGSQASESKSNEGVPNLSSLRKNTIISGDPFTFSTRVRDKHYRFNITKLEQLLKTLNEELIQIELDRHRFTILMQREQKKLMELQLEKDRLKNFKGDMITSTVLHGTLMRYDVESFTVDVQAAWENSLGTIATTKRNLIEGESRKRDVRLEIQRKEELLKDRIAAYKSFEKERDKAIIAVQRIRGSNDQTLKRIFDRLRNGTQIMKNQRLQVIKLVNGLIKRYLKAAFSKWSRGFFGSDVSDDKSGYQGVGSVLLDRVKKSREDVQEELREMIATTAAIQKELMIIDISRSQRRKLLHSTYLPGMEEGLDYVKLNQKQLRFLCEADAYTIYNKFDRAYGLYEAQIISLRSEPTVNIKLLAICYGRLGRLFLKEERFDRAIVEFDRQMSLSKEIQDKVEEAEAYFGIGTGYLGRCDYVDAIRYLELAQIRFEVLGHIPKACGTMKAMRECYARMMRSDLVDIYTERINAIEQEEPKKNADAYKNLDILKERLVVQSAEEEMTVELERVTYRTVELRQFIDDKLNERNQRQEELDSQIEGVEKLQFLLDAIQKELAEAVESDEDKMISYLVHDIPQEVEIEELKSKLTARRIVELQNYSLERSQQTKLETMIKNIEHEVDVAKEDLELESGQLMSAIKANKPFRCIAFNPANAAGNEVTGTASGGVESFVAAESSNVYLFDIHIGRILHVWPGDEETRVGDKKGHVAVVTCIIYDELRVYSGSADETIMVWDTTSHQRLLVLEGHEGSIVTMAIDGPLLLSGSADATVRMWEKLTGKLLKIIVGHSLSVLSMEVGPTWLVTGSADEEVRLWSIIQKSEISYQVESQLRLIGHDTAVTCVRYGKLEIASGDNLGRVFVWWLETGAILRKCQIHKGPVKCLQFDATRIVSGGFDQTVCITDIGSGEVLQSLRGHSGPILTLAFDTERILSASTDNTVKYWIWGKKTGPQNKYHVLDSGETLTDLAKIYKISLEELMRWNGISDIRQVFPGMRLLVAKGDSSFHTDAEDASLERDRKRGLGLEYSNMKLKELISEYQGVSIADYDRVSRVANDMDARSLGNRMFKKEKVANELFPDTIDVHKDVFSLNSRLLAGGLSPDKKKVPPPVISGDNVEEWALIADSLGTAMIEIYVEHVAYEVAKEVLGSIRDYKTFGGRIAKHILSDILQTSASEPSAEQVKEKQNITIVDSKPTMEAVKSRKSKRPKS